ncbi:hypothetical protein GCM10022256_07880 [Frondihabitans peucedani]|uniref:Uncharacterized protein n=1 Tax=Frondihabitans peucedani TaxID=598626 RepID=A0ABP8DZ27_9MICO
MPVLHTRQYSFVMQIEARRLTDHALGHLVRVDGETFVLGAYHHKKRTNFVVLEEPHTDAQLDTYDFFSLAVHFHAVVEILD